MTKFFKFMFFQIDDYTSKVLALICWIVALWLMIAVDANALERDYQQVWCAQHGGETEVVLRDRTRVDCAASIDGKLYAIEFDFAKKWAEAIGQALYYGKMMNREPGIVLIVEDFKKDMKYIDRITYALQGTGIRLWLTR